VTVWLLSTGAERVRLTLASVRPVGGRAFRARARKAKARCDMGWIFEGYGQWHNLTDDEAARSDVPPGQLTLYEGPVLGADAPAVGGVVYDESLHQLVIWLDRTWLPRLTLGSAQVLLGTQVAMDEGFRGWPMPSTRAAVHTLSAAIAVWRLNGK
jgi:hypothetical protein